MLHPRCILLWPPLHHNADMRIKKPIAALVVSIAFPLQAWSAHPLVTDDTGTQGRGFQQIEANAEWVRQDGVLVRVAAITYTFGAHDDLDVYINLPRTLTSPSGINDISIGAKWRFYQAGPLIVDLKPEVLLPTGDDNKALGHGRSNVLVTLIASYDAFPWTLHANAGVVQNRFRLADANDANRRTLWRASAAAWYAVNPGLKIVMDTGIERNAEKNSQRNPGFVLAGVIYSPRSTLDFDVGIKRSLNEVTPQRQAGVGVTFRH